MRTAPNQLLFMGAAGILALGVAWSAVIYASRPTYQGTDPAKLQEMAQRIQTAQDAPPELTNVPAAPVTLPAAPRIVAPTAAATPVKQGPAGRAVTARVTTTPRTTPR